MTDAPTLLAETPTLLANLNTWVQIIANLFVVGGAIFAVIQYRNSMKFGQIQYLQHFLDTVRDLENQLGSADAAVREGAAFAYFNQIETIAMAINHKMVGKPTYTLLSETLTHYLRAIENTEGLRSLFKSSLDDATTYSEIRKFSVKENHEKLNVIFAEATRAKNKS